MAKEKNSSCQKDYVEGGITYNPESVATVLSNCSVQSDSVKSPDDMNKKAQDEIKALQMPSL